MVDEDKRTATDILLSIETQLSTLGKRIQNSEYLLKTLLSKTNKGQSSIPPVSLSIPQMESLYPIDVINKDNFENRPKTNKFSKMASSQGINLDDSQTGTYITKSAENGGNMIEASLRGVSRGQRGSKPKGPKSSVSQVLSNENGVLFLANIEVLDENSELVSQTRTNTKGRWLMALAPGDYQVHITKRFPPDSGKKSIDTTYQINVPKSDKPLELEPYILE